MRDLRDLCHAAEGVNERWQAQGSPAGFIYTLAVTASLGPDWLVAGSVVVACAWVAHAISMFVAYRCETRGPAAHGAMAANRQPLLLRSLCPCRHAPHALHAPAPPQHQPPLNLVHRHGAHSSSLVDHVVFGARPHAPRPVEGPALHGLHERSPAARDLRLPASLGLLRRPQPLAPRHGPPGPALVRSTAMRPPLPPATGPAETCRNGWEAPLATQVHVH